MAKPRVLKRCFNDRCPLHRAMRTLAYNLKWAGALCASFKAGDNFGFHMGEDSSQCTCQWSPGAGVPYVGWTRCEQVYELAHEAGYPDACDVCNRPTPCAIHQ